jgi:hypothetical protein
MQICIEAPGAGFVVAGPVHKRQARFAELQTMENKAFVGFVSKRLENASKNS